MVSKAGKMLLKNTIQSTELQNRIKEEREMWTKKRNERHEDNERRVQSRDSVAQSYRKRHCDEDIHESHKRHKTKDTKRDNYWLKRLMSEEEKHSNSRWTHNGFKELYSSELATDSRSSDSSEEEMRHKKSKKKRKHKKDKKHKKTKKKKKKGKE
ncbi:unnamed protein product [Oppiella nova]|uniref:Uncharacterized protein n=1 Tax=Oppiella nova TaxID=334625 RepID=A0A7R9QWD4_9ACAR|nr:unnamed protein product [Oppiella nova]CAG2177519.1 unnamed protein product [Oppiella nova]